jgi:hypothetical protein
MEAYRRSFRGDEAATLAQLEAMSDALALALDEVDAGRRTRSS